MRISFHGAAREVTGSCHLFEVTDSAGKTHRILFDCGMFQGEKYADERNREPFGFDPKSVEAVFLSHPHADHTGRISKLVDEGFSGSIYLTPPCRPLAKLVLEDAYSIMKDNARRAGEELLYEIEDVERAFALTKTVSYHEAVEIAPGITVMFHDAGHVLGSAYLSLEAEGKRVIFSGDIGNAQVPILPDTEPISHADAVICESTYGHRTHEPTNERGVRLKECLTHCLSQNGVMLIPAFSIERTQELLYELNQILLHDLKTPVPIFLDSPMAIKATQAYRDFKEYLRFDAPIISDPDRDFFSFPNLRETLTTEESKAIFDAPSPKVIIAGSGMMSGGRIMHHLRRYLPESTTTLLIIGYQAQGTLGRRIYEGAKHVRIFREDIEVRATVKAIGAFSAHGDMDKLTQWLKPEDGKIPAKIFLVHGDPDAQDVFATHLRHELRTEVIVPERGQAFEL